MKKEPALTKYCFDDVRFIKQQCDAASGCGNETKPLPSRAALKPVETC